MIDPILATKGATDRGTRIVKKGQEMDKNAFLKILTTELTNQDPMNAKDSTAYISQLAQFSSLEQMANLNGTMSFNSASDLVGKTVALNAYDENNKQYGGIVRNVTKDGDNITVTVTVAKYKGDTIVGYEDKDFAYKDVAQILDMPDDNTQLLSYLTEHMNYLNSNMNFMAASALINKSVDLKTIEDGTDKDYSGKVLEAFKTKDGVKLKVATEPDGTEKEFFYNEVTKIKNN